MDDWEDAGLSIGIIALIFLCMILGCWKLDKRNEQREEYLLNNPV